MVQYAVRRTRTRLRRFAKLCDEVRAGKIDEQWLARVEYLDNLFPNIDYRAYRPRS